MITDGVLLGIITALAIIGSIHIIETLFRLLTRLIGSGKNASRLSVGVEAGLNLQLGTSVWLSWLALTRKARCQYVHGDEKKRPFSGIVAVTLISGVLLTTVLLLEVAVVYMSQPVTIYSTLGKGAIKTFIVQAAGNVTTADFNSQGILEISQSAFSESRSLRHVSTAFMNIVDVHTDLAQALANASIEEGRTISAWTEYTVDGRNTDGSAVHKNARRRKSANTFTLFVIGRAYRLFTVTAERAVETLNTSRTYVFTDFGEDEAAVMEKEFFTSLGFGCIPVNKKIQNATRATEYSCTLTKNLMTENFLSELAGVITAIDQARANIARQIFKVADYSVEWKSINTEEVLSAPGEQIRGIFAIETGVNSSSSGFILLCVAAAFGVARLVQGVFVDYRGIAESNLFRAACTGSYWEGPANQDRSEGFRWRVYRVGDRNCFGFTKREWSDDCDTPCNG